MVTLGAHDLERSILSYHDGLGFPLPESPEGIAFFELNGTWLSLYARDLLAEDATVSSEGSGFQGFAIAHNVRSEAAVAAVLAVAATARATFIKPAQKVFWGGYSGHFQDPDTFLWEVARNPFIRIGPADYDTTEAPAS